MRQRYIPIRKQCCRPSSPDNRPRDNVFSLVSLATNKFPSGGLESSIWAKKGYVSLGDVLFCEYGAVHNSRVLDCVKFVVLIGVPVS